MNDFELSWAAGFFDGEGCVVISPRGSNGSYYTIYAWVGQVNKRPLLKFQELFGGVVKFSKNTSAGNPYYIWRVAATIAENALQLMYPFSLDKREEISKALEMQNAKSKGKNLGSKPYSPEDQMKFKHIYDEFKEIKTMRRKGLLSGVGI